MAYVLADPTCRRHVAPGIDGVIPYRRAFGCAVAVGDPLCDLADRDALALSFEAACHARRLRPLFAAASQGFADRCTARGYSAIEFGEELVLDPRRDPQTGGHGRELRKNVRRARDAGVEVHERTRSSPELDAALEAVARRWRAARHGPQVFLVPIILFPDANRRCLYADCGGHVVGMLTMMPRPARQGWVFEHVMADPDAPKGTSESLVVRALQLLGAEGCRYASFGPTPRASLGSMVGLGPVARRIATATFGASSSLFHLDSRAHYQRKFQPRESEPSYVLFGEHAFGARAILGLLAAFHVALAP
ncbi:MAG: phosphatidylglycerol lysyltransferase domain-containing protein [Kofleriaceae bacterium]